MLFPAEKSQAVSLFDFINQLYENTSFIITTNKTPADWLNYSMMRFWQLLYWIDAGDWLKKPLNESPLFKDFDLFLEGNGINIYI